MSINNKLKKFEHQRKRLKFYTKVKQVKVKELKNQWKDENNGKRRVQQGSYKDLWNSAKDRLLDKGKNSGREDQKYGVFLKECRFSR